jgi:hypothetical protein
MRLFRVELRRLLARRTVRVLLLAFAVLIVVIMLGNSLSSTDEEPLRWEFVRDSGLGLGGGFATLAFVLGASAGGAEWGARTIEALLVWEPRRVRLLLTKAAVLAVVVLIGAIVVQVLAGLLSRGAVAWRGSMVGAPDDLWSTFLGNSATGASFAVITAVLGFGIASLTRNTGFALGTAFVYVAFIERLLSLLGDWVDSFMLFNNAGAFLQHGIDLTRDDGTTYELTTFRGGVTLVVYVAVVLAAAVTTFNRRDVT